MAILVESLILAVITLLLTYFLRSKNSGDLSIPYATYGTYPLVGHLFAFLRDRTKLLLECRQRYDECFRIRVFSQYVTMILSHADWMNVVRNPSFQFSAIEFGIQIFDLSPTFYSKYQPFK
jgi:hypothetical protein